MYLVDTSVWIKHFSKKDPFNLKKTCLPEERILCLPVYQEILQGIKSENIFREVQDILDSAIFIENPLAQSIFLEAAGLYRLARKNGLTIRSSVDCLIAACAIKNNITVLHHDRDFSLLSTISMLDEKNTFHE
ncbi:Ribonuclease VapC11 [subsurface metagenome]